MNYRTIQRHSDGTENFTYSSDHTMDLSWIRLGNGELIEN